MYDYSIELEISLITVAFFFIVLWDEHHFSVALTYNWNNMLFIYIFIYIHTHKHTIDFYRPKTCFLLCCYINIYKYICKYIFIYMYILKWIAIVYPAVWFKVKHLNPSTNPDVFNIFFCFTISFDPLVESKWPQLHTHWYSISAFLSISFFCFFVFVLLNCCVYSNN